jgi:HEAT repeat protein
MLELPGVPFEHTLRAAILENSVDWSAKRVAAELLSVADPKKTTRSVLDLFFGQTEADEALQAGLLLEKHADLASVPLLIEALHDENPHRRRGAARALGWIRRAGNRAAEALVEVVVDKSQPEAVRETAAESVSYRHYRKAIPALISVLDDPSPGVRFWVCFALGTLGQSWSRQSDAEAIRALERMLADEEIAPGWWSVRREALGMLASMEPKYEAELRAERKRVLQDPTASPGDKSWAECYDHV